MEDKINEQGPRTKTEYLRYEIEVGQQFDYSALLDSLCSTTLHFDNDPYFIHQNVLHGRLHNNNNTQLVRLSVSHPFGLITVA